MSMFSIEYRYFHQSAVDKSFRQAGENLNINSSALVRQIYKLEGRLNLKLFIRSSKGLELTPQGNILFKYISDHLEKNDKFLSNIHQVEGNLEKTITISTVETIAIYFLSKVVKEFQSKYKYIKFDINTKKPDSILDDLILNKSDIGLTFTKEQPKTLKIVYEKKVPLGILCSPKHELASKENLKISECLIYPLVFHPGTLTVWKKLQREMGFSSKHIKPKIISNSYAFIKSYLKENEQALFFSTRLGALLEISEGTLIHKKVNNKTFINNHLGILINKNNLQDKVTEHFIKDLSKYLNQINLN